MPSPEELIPDVKRLSERLDKRIATHKRLEPYIEGECPFPPAVSEARLTKLYRYLMPVAEAPWGSLIVDSKLDRLEISGLQDANTAQDSIDKVWSAWQANWMDSESKLGHGAALLDGRFYVTVWPNEDRSPDIALDDMTQMIVEFEPGSRRKRRAALRRWQDGDRVFATLYREDGIYKFQGPEPVTTSVANEWEKRTVPDEDWPVENPFDTVNVVEIAVNRRLKPGRFPFARGDFEHCVGLIDRINLLTFLGLVVAFWMGFPLRGVIGDKIRRRVLRDDDGNPLIDADTGKEKTEAIPPFDAHPDRVFQLENPDAKLAEFKAADRKNLSVFAELDQLAVISKTPRHYFPLEQGMSNLSAEAITASEGGMHAAVSGHKSTLGDGWVEVNRLVGQLLRVKLSPSARVEWKDNESRSLAERADAASKLKDILPAMAVAEIALGATQDQVKRWQSQQAVNPLMQILSAAQQPPPVPPTNGTPPVAVPAG